ncbi:MAG: PAS domain S-box protein [Flavobacteriales bacterium]|nr:PAS domain S-box protein [Flavobacteriales bacterium]
MNVTQNQKERIVELEKEVAELKSSLNIALEENKRGATWFQNIIDTLPNPLFIKNNNSQYTTTNDAFEGLVGVSKEGLVGKTDTDFFSAEEAEVFLRIDSEILTNGGISWNEEKLTRNGETHDLITSKVRVWDGEGNRYLLGLITDITDKESQHVELWQKKDELERERKNNETLLKEVHHRVKNNLQIISSLLSLQMTKFKEVEVHKAFENCKQRILAMANVHEILYKTSNFSNINFSTYVQTLIQNLKNSYNIDKEINFKIDVINIFLNEDIAIPLGMAINEIVINSIKHGRVEGQQLDIYLKLYVNGDTCILEIGDNGKGVGEIKPSEQITFGIELLELFCNQIDANLIQQSQAKGIHYKVSFPKKR